MKIFPNKVTVQENVPDSIHFSELKQGQFGIIVDPATCKFNKGQVVLKISTGEVVHLGNGKRWMTWQVESCPIYVRPVSGKIVIETGDYDS